MTDPTTLTDSELLAEVERLHRLRDDTVARGELTAPGSDDEGQIQQELDVIYEARRAVCLEARRRTALFVELAAAVELDAVLGEILDSDT